MSNRNRRCGPLWWPAAMGLALAATLAGCGRATPPAAAPATPHGVLPAVQQPASPPVTAAAAPLPRESVYLVTSAWRDQGDRPVVLAELRGRIVVVSLVFTHCKYACPRIVADMQKIERQLSAAEKADVRFLLVSMDPERDTPKRLTTFAAEHKLDLERWTLLTGPPGDVRVLNAVLGGRYKKAPSGDFAHSNLVLVLDRDGRIVHRHEGLEIAPTEALASIRKIGAAAAAARAQP